MNKRTPSSDSALASSGEQGIARKVGEEHERDPSLIAAPARRAESSTAVNTSRRPQRRVQLLDTRLANQIAAGEVVERPASVLKELMENALDAGATHIVVQVERGGAARISVRDDGCGIHKDDLMLALARHTTSKIATLRELEALATMGFRGEALPSIASVSRLKLDSRSAGADTAFSVTLSGGIPEAAVSPSAHPRGTTVEIRDLFFNTPARRRFLRTERTEVQHLEQVFRRIALARMDVAMRLEHNGRTVLRLSAALDERQRRSRLQRLLGSAFVNSARGVDHQAQGFALQGWIADVDKARPRPDMQYLFINQRCVMDATVRHAVRMAYGERLANGLHPAWVLLLGMDPTGVDVNVHPSKQEVRFHEVRSVHDFFRQAVAQSLSVDATPSSRPSPVRRAPPGSTAAPIAPDAPMTSGTEQQQGVKGLMLLAGNLVLCRIDDALVVALGDTLRVQHAALMLEQALSANDLRSRPLLLPERFDVDEAQQPQLTRALPALESLGIGLRQLSATSWMLLRVPACFGAVTPAALIETMREGLAAARADSAPTSADAWIATLAQALAGVPLTSAEEGAELMRALDRALPAKAPRPWRGVPSDLLMGLARD